MFEEHQGGKPQFTSYVAYLPCDTNSIIFKQRQSILVRLILTKMIPHSSWNNCTISPFPFCSQFTLRYFNIILHVKLPFQTGCNYCFTYPPNLVHFKQVAVMVFIPTSCWSWRQHFTHINLARKFWSPIVYIKLCPSINKQYSSDSFLDWKGYLLVFAHLIQTTASDLSLVAALLSLSLLISTTTHTFADTNKIPIILPPSPEPSYQSRRSHSANIILASDAEQLQQRHCSSWVVFPPVNHEGPMLPKYPMSAPPCSLGRSSLSTFIRD